MFGENLKKLRMARGLSQEELGELTQLGQSNISAWERGGRMPLPDGLIKLALFFECSIDYLVGCGNHVKDEDLVLLEQSYLALSEENKEKVKIYIESLSNN